MAGTATGAEKKILFLAGADSHGWGAHEHTAGSTLLAERLKNSGLPVEVTVIREWPSGEVLKKHHALVIYADGWWLHPANGHLVELKEFMDAGGGLTVIHWATGAGSPDIRNKDKDHSAEPERVQWRNLVGADFEPWHSCSRFWDASFSKLPEHPVTRGVPPFTIHDECYFHLRCNDPEHKHVTPLHGALPPQGVIKPGGMDSGSVSALEAVKRGEEQYCAWGYERPQGGRTFGFTGGHTHWHWARDELRKLILNGIYWSAGGEVPKAGIDTPRPTAAEMLAGLKGNPGWTEDSLQIALDRAGAGELIKWQTYGKTLPFEKKAAEGGALAEPAEGAFVTLEGEDLKVLSTNTQARPQDMTTYGAWSGNSQLWWTGGQPGDLLILEIPVAVDGVYRIGAGFTKAIDYGIFEISIDGRKLAGPIDLFNNGVIHTGTIALGGAVKLAAGTHKLEVKITGANPAAKKSYMLGLDYVVLASGEKADVTTLKPKQAAANPPSPAQRSGLKEGNADDAEPKSADEQQSLFTVPEGFEIELVAGEEQGLPKPVMTSFDNAGRMWSVTATAYPCDNDSAIWKKPGNDRVVVIDNPTARGPRTVRAFAEDMVMPLCVLPSENGAYVAQGPDILFLEDTNGDGRADSRKVLLSGFGIQDTHTLPHQLTRMPGGRIVYSQGVLNTGRVKDAAGRSVDFNRTLVATFRPDGTGHEIIGSGMNNIWAWSVSREGQVFIHEANDFGYSLVPFEEDSSYPSFVQTKIHPDAPFHPPTAEGLNLGGTGFSGLALCDDRAGSFPAPWHGLMFVANPITGRINSVAMEKAPNGVFNFTKKDDLVSCSDPMFRPVAITFGPDGCLYITDWYNRIISHNEVARDHPARDRSRGRVWRVRHKSQPERIIPNMTKVPATELPRHLKADSTWEMRAAWQEIASRGGKALVPELTTLIREAATADDARIHALWALEDLGHFDASLWSGFFASGNPHVRREAVRAMSSLKVPASEAFTLLQPLAGETAWTVRYEILRFFRRAAGTTDPAHLAWLARWSESPADQTKVNGWKGPYLALGGPYERAFQDFLLQLVREKGTSRPIEDNSKYDAVIATQPARSAAETDTLVTRTAAVKKLVTHPGERTADEGKQLVQSLCLTCHQIGGKGISLAPPLDGSASRDVDALITSILDPDAAVENVFRLYRVETKDGVKYEGFRKSADSKEITLMFMGGSTQAIPTDNVKTAGYIQGKSAMPALGAGLSNQQIADIVRHLRTVK